VNLVNTAVGLGVANTITQGMFNSNLVDFFTGNKDGKYVAGSDGANRLTLPELLGQGSIKFGGNYGSGGATLTSVLKDNFEKNWFAITGGVILIPMVAKVATKLLRKPVLTPMNRMIKMTGLDVKV
jgi:hypothetical protein